MKLNEYQEQAMTTCMPTSHNWAYAMGLLLEEAGELQGKVDKAIRKGKVVINDNQLCFLCNSAENTELIESMVKELGDVGCGLHCGCAGHITSDSMSSQP